MPELPQNPEQQDDLLEKLLAGAAEREARKAMKELEEKGTVTKAEFSKALGEFENRLIETVTSQFSEKLQKAVPPTPAEPEIADEPVQKAGRKGTIQSSDPRMDNPTRYLIQKGRSGEQYDDTDRAVIWELTRRGFVQGMSTLDIEGPDFADEYQY